MTVSELENMPAGGADFAGDLDRLARHYAILPDYHDVWGQRRVVSDETKRKVLTAMGVPCADADAVRHSLMEAAEQSRRLLDPVKVVPEQEPLAVTVGVAEDARNGSLAWRVIEEHGAVHDGTARLEELPGRQAPAEGFVDLELALELKLQPGYHQLRVILGTRRADMSLIVVPAHCHLPDALTAGDRWWGLAAQLYGVRRHDDWGMGDYAALPALVDVCAQHGAAMLALSPLHAMFPSWPAHASPYSPSSRLFLNVLYIDLERAADVTGSPAARERLIANDTQAELERLRALELVDYRAVAELKLPILELAYADFATDPSSLRYRQFRQFCESEGDTLLRHAVFEALHERFCGLDPAASAWPHWPLPFQDPASAAVARFAETHAHRVDFHRWLQWLAEEQVSAAARHAEDRSLGIGLYMDLAVSVDRCGAETWCNRHLYSLGASLGAPSDKVSVKGQNWGLPPLNPRSLYESGYALFIDTVRRNMRHAGALRIDHVMGLMRLFWIPEGDDPDDGAYVRYPVDDLLGIVALESQRNRCLVIGEDLGTVPEGLQERLAQFRVLSYRLLYFEQDDAGHFRKPEEYLSAALVAVSTHDLPTLAGWWQSRDTEWRIRLDLFPDTETGDAMLRERERERLALGEALRESGLEPSGSDGGASVPSVPAHRFLARAPSMLMLVQLEDTLGLVEQANLPATVDAHPNWRRRLPVAVEDLEDHEGFQAVVSALAEERGTAAEPDAAAPTLPHGTYRLQLHRDFTFDQARELVPYLRGLGISHAYASPYLQSRAGSTHGYDITDHSSIDQEIGSAHAHGEWVSALKARGMGHVLDIVPNHMGVMGDDNAWWLDVLEHGEAARHSHYFDIDWQPSERALAGKVLLPVLGAPYGEILDSGELVLEFDAAGGRLVVRYYEHLFPLDPREYPMVLNRRLPAPEDGEPPQGLTESVSQELASISAALGRLPRRSETGRSAVAERYRDSELLRQRLLRLYREVPAVAQRIEAQVAAFNSGRGLHPLLERQAWRLAHWRTASDEINYRRFFDINDLAGLRIQDPEVFEAVHRRVLELVESGAVSGLRIDHPDGLYDPAGYFRRLRDRCSEVLPRQAEPIFLLAEKILAADERLPLDWNVSGTTGYDFGATLNGLFVDPRGEQPLTRCYEEFIGAEVDVEDLAYQCKHLVMRRLLAGELQVLGNRLHRIGQADPHTRDYTRNNLVEALREVVACFPVYRTYVRGPVVSEQDRAHIELAIARARRRNTALDGGVFDFLCNVLLQREAGSPGPRRAMQDFTMKLQQFTAPVTAKGVEDTLFYRYARLLSLNEVGDEPARFGVPVAEFHRHNAYRLANWPDSMTATSSHDSKRGEDVRARLNVLSELPEEWSERVAAWHRHNERYLSELEGRPAPSANDEYFLYQTLLGSWPLEGLHGAERRNYLERIQSYMIKVVREAKVHTSWTAPESRYEDAVTAFVAAVLDAGANGAFVDDLADFVRRVGPIGLLNGLSQTVLKLTVPGVPDIYQGSELWNFDLVDPDNRRPVDYDRRRALQRRLRRLSQGQERELLAEKAVPNKRTAALLEEMAGGLPKLHVIRQILALRGRVPRLFARGDYVPLPSRGELAGHVCAFARQDGADAVVVVAPRLTAGLCRPDGQPPLGDRWHDTEMELPAAVVSRGGTLVDVLTGACHKPRNRLALGDVLAHFPVAVLAEREAALQGGRMR